MDDVSSIRMLDGIPMVRTAQELEQHLTSPEANAPSVGPDNTDLAQAAGIALSHLFCPPLFS